MTFFLLLVMAGLDPAISRAGAHLFAGGALGDARIKSGHDAFLEER